MLVRLVVRIIPETVFLLCEAKAVARKPLRAKKQERTSLLLCHHTAKIETVSGLFFSARRKNLLRG
jgi:hypothetical protein